MLDESISCLIDWQLAHDAPGLEERVKGNFEYCQAELTEKAEWLEKLEKQCLQLIEQEANHRRDEYKGLELYSNKRFTSVEENIAEMIKNIQHLDSVTKEVIDHHETLQA